MDVFLMAVKTPGQTIKARKVRTVAPLRISNIARPVAEPAAAAIMSPVSHSTQKTMATVVLDTAPLMASLPSPPRRQPLAAARSVVAGLPDINDADLNHLSSDISLFAPLPEGSSAFAVPAPLPAEPSPFKLPLAVDTSIFDMPTKPVAAARPKPAVTPKPLKQDIFARLAGAGDAVSRGRSANAVPTPFTAAAQAHIHAKPLGSSPKAPASGIPRAPRSAASKMKSQLRAPTQSGLRQAAEAAREKERQRSDKRAEQLQREREERAAKTAADEARRVEAQQLKAEEEAKKQAARRAEHARREQQRQAARRAEDERAREEKERRKREFVPLRPSVLALSPTDTHPKWMPTFIDSANAFDALFTGIRAPRVRRRAICDLRETAD